jgi:hypothetical protein
MSRPERVGLLLVRAWIEDADPVLKARITYTLDLVSNGQVVRTAATRAGIDEVVSEWLNQLENKPLTHQ